MSYMINGLSHENFAPMARRSRATLHVVLPRCISCGTSPYFNPVLTRISNGFSPCRIKVGYLLTGPAKKTILQCKHLGNLVCASNLFLRVWQLLPAHGRYRPLTGTIIRTRALSSAHANFRSLVASILGLITGK